MCVFGVSQHTYKLCIDTARANYIGIGYSWERVTINNDGKLLDRIGIKYIHGIPIRSIHSVKLYIFFFFLLIFRVARTVSVYLRSHTLNTCMVGWANVNPGQFGCPGPLRFVCAISHKRYATALSAMGQRQTRARTDTYKLVKSSKIRASPIDKRERTKGIKRDRSYCFETNMDYVYLSA